MAQLPGDIERKLLRGAGRAAATVIATEAKVLSISSEVDGAIKVKVTATDGRIMAKVQVRGKGAHIAPWLEYGTKPHLISVDESQRGGKSVKRINTLANETDSNHSLVIGGKFVGATVMHPGARPHPFLRPALDTKEAEAIAAAQNFINGRLTRAGIVGAAEGDDE